MKPRAVQQRAGDTLIHSWLWWVSVTPIGLTLLVWGAMCGEGLVWYSPVRDTALAMCDGRIVVAIREFGGGYNTAEHAQMYAKDLIWPKPLPFFPFGFGSVVIDLRPILSLSLVPPLFACGAFRRWCWWTEVFPGVPLICLVLAFNGHVFRTFADQGFIPAFRNIVTAIEALGVICIIPVTATWILLLPRNLRNERRKRAEGPRCARCGYLLIGLTDPRCPECGTPFDPFGPRGIADS